MHIEISYRNPTINTNTLNETAPHPVRARGWINPRLAEHEEAIVVVPVVLEAVRVQFALGVVPVEVRHVAIPVGVREHGAEYCQEPSGSLRIDASLR